LSYPLWEGKKPFVELFNSLRPFSDLSFSWFPFGVAPNSLFIIFGFKVSQCFFSLLSPNADSVAFSDLKVLIHPWEADFFFSSIFPSPAPFVAFPLVYIQDRHF